MTRLIHGSGGKSGEQHIPVEVPDNLVSDDFATILDLVSEGEIEGLVAGLKSIYLDDVPLQNADGSFNFSGVTVETRNGTAGQPAITMIEGTESENAVGVEVKFGAAIERSVVNSEVDRVRVTIGIPQLTYQNESTGDINGSSVQYKISISANGGAFVDAAIGGGSWVPFNGSTTPAGATAFRAAVRYTPTDPNTPSKATVRLDYRLAGSSDPWTVAGQSVASYDGELNSGTSSLFEVYGLSPASYELQAVLVSTTEASPGTVSVVSGAVGNAYTTGTITGKTTSRYKRSHIINLRTFGASPYIVRVTRITPDSTKTVLQNKTYWDSYTEIIDEKLRYPHSALVATRMSSKQFSNIPARGFHIRGVKVKIPSNYDPIARTYTGMWDGLFVVGWTNNPAWVFYDLATNDRYGVGEYIDASMIDKWALYSIAQYCDELVPNGKGGQEPRYACNLYLQTREQAHRALMNIASIFRGMVYWATGAVIPVADKPADPVYLFNQANVVDGIFNYSGSAYKVRRNAAYVTWNDPNDRYRTKVEYVSDDEAIASMGFVNPVEVYATGCTSQGQARRVGKWIIYTERYENELVNFKVGMDGNIPKPGDFIQVADVARAGERLGGRLKAGSTTTSIVLDAPVAIASGTTYTLTIVTDTGALETRTVTTGVGTASTLTIGSAYSAAPPAGSLWILASSALEPQTFRVLTVTEEDEGNVYAISGLNSYSAKYATIESDEPLSIPKTSKLLEQWQPPAAPTGLVLTENLYLTAASAVQSKLTVSWDSAPVGGNVTLYEYSYRVGLENNWSPPVQVPDTTFDILGLNDGDAVAVSVWAVNSKSVKSAAPVSGTAVIAGKAVPPSGVTGFTVTRSGNTLNFSWTHIADIDRSHYEIRRGNSWTSGIPVGSSAANAFSMEAPRGGTYLIKAIDQSGNLSVSAASVTIGDSAAISNALSHDEATGGWNGTNTNCTDYSLSATTAWSDLTTWSAMTTWDAGSSKTGVLENAGAPAASVYVGETIDLGASKKVYVTADFDVGALNAAAVVWSNLTQAWSAYTNNWNAYGGNATITFNDAISASLSYQTSPDGTNWSQALPFVPGTYTARYFRFVVTMDSSDPSLSAYLYGLRAYFDLLERQLHFSNQSIASGGTTISFSPPFAVLQTIQVTNQGGATGDTNKTSARSTSGVTINLYTSAGVAKAGNADIDVFGYGEA